MSKGGGETTTETQINAQMRQGGQELQGAASDFFNQGTSGIYQGTRLAEYNPLIEQGEQQGLDYWSQGGAGQQMTNNAMQSYNQLLGAGDYDNPFLREQIESLTGQATGDFLRNVAPRLDQGATAAGQFGSSRAGVAEGIAMGDTQQAISQGTINALLGGQQLALQANGMLPQMQMAGNAGADYMSRIGGQRTLRDQARLEDEIQMFEAPRNAELMNMQQYAGLMNSNPLMNEQTQIQTAPESDPWAQALGLGLTGASMFATGGALNPATMGGIGAMFGGGGGGVTDFSSIPGMNFEGTGLI